jgi:hypothetical protein
MHMPDVDTEDTTLWGWTLGHMVSPREDGGFVGPGRQGGVGPHHTLELSLEACLGFCQAETRTEGSLNSGQGVPGRRNTQGKGKFTATYLYCHSLRSLLLLRTGTVSNCLKDVSI